MSSLVINEKEELIQVQIEEVYSLFLKKELIAGIVVDTEYISIHFINELQLSDFKIPIGKDDDFTKLQLEFLRMIGNK